MLKLIISPAYQTKEGTPKCDHKREKHQFGEYIYEFCDKCGAVWIHKKE